MKDKILLAIVKTLFVWTLFVLSVEVVLIIKHLYEFGVN